MCVCVEKEETQDDGPVAIPQINCEIVALKTILME